ncbi:MAG: alanine racemase [Chloroflexi bacterium]|nr:alanine racemase [Chloroflexota bacterium]
MTQSTAQLSVPAESAQPALSHQAGSAARAVVDLAALRHNVAALRASLRAESRLIAVVKADAYGHGAAACAAAALDAGADALAVGRVGEGLALRGLGIDVPILVLGHCTDGETEPAVAAGLTLTPSNAASLDAVAAVADRLRRPAALHVKVDTGMRRLGLAPAAAARVIAMTRAHPGLRLMGIYTHFACADDPDPTRTEQQFRRFREFAATVDPDHALTWHVCNTAAARRFPHMHLDAVRTGIGLYGVDPVAAQAPPIGLRPALSLRAGILRCFDLAPGESLGYGATFIADRPLRIATVACGYADGLPRALSNRGEALVRGRRCPIVGRVSMDLCTIDVSAVDGASPADEVVFIGDQGAATLSADEVAGCADTISYELLCSISARVRRTYTG